MSRTIAIAATMAALALFASSANASTGPVGHWLLNEGSGSVAADTSGHRDNGTLRGGAEWTSISGRRGVSFDGTTGQVRVPEASQLDPSNAITVSAWVLRQGSPGDYRYIVAKGGHGCISASYGLYSGPNGGLQFYVSRGQGTTYARSPDAGTGVWDGRWHLAVGTFDGTTIRLYVDGLEVGSGTEYPGPIEYRLSDSNDLLIGDYPSCLDEGFPGVISDVRLWDRALSPSEVSAISAQPPAPGSAPTSGSSPGSSTGNGSSSGNGGGIPGGNQTGGLGGGSAQQASAPTIRHLVMSSTTLAVGARLRVPVIRYTDSAAARVTFTILRIQSRAARTRCIKAARDRHRNAKSYCPRYVALKAFTHRDRVGRNLVKFPRALVPRPGSYALYVTPSLNGRVGKTHKVSFKVVLRRHP